jgi:hypothetical protein
MEFLKLVTVATGAYLLYPIEQVRITVNASNVITAVETIGYAAAGTHVYTAISLTGLRADMGLYTSKAGFHTILSSEATAT